MTWAELQFFQLDSLHTLKTLALDADCPQSLKQIQENFTKHVTRHALILGNKYIWSEYYNNQDKKCLVKHDKQDTLTQKKPNPEFYDILNTLNAQILLSAIDHLGFNREKGMILIMYQKNDLKS